MTRLAAIGFALLFAVSGMSYAKGGHGSSTHSARSQKAKYEFRKHHSCPSTGRSSGACPGYVVDHIKPLKRGGPDAAGNMQWQTLAEAKAKDRIE